MNLTKFQSTICNGVNILLNTPVVKIEFPTKNDYVLINFTDNIKQATKCNSFNSTKTKMNFFAKVYPDLSNGDIEHARVFREPFVQSLHDLNAADRENRQQTQMAGFYIANSSMIHNSTLNNNAAITLAKEVVGRIAGK